MKTVSLTWFILIIALDCGNLLEHYTMVRKMSANGYKAKDE